MAKTFLPYLTTFFCAIGLLGECGRWSIPWLVAACTLPLRHNVEAIWTCSLFKAVHGRWASLVLPKQVWFQFNDLGDLWGLGGNWTMDPFDAHTLAIMDSKLAVRLTTLSYYCFAWELRILHIFSLQCIVSKKIECRINGTEKTSDWASKLILIFARFLSQSLFSPSLQNRQTCRPTDIFTQLIMRFWSFPLLSKAVSSLFYFCEYRGYIMVARFGNDNRGKPFQSIDSQLHEAKKTIFLFQRFACLRTVSQLMRKEILSGYFFVGIRLPRKHISEQCTRFCERMFLLLVTHALLSSWSEEKIHGKFKWSLLKNHCSKNSWINWVLTYRLIYILP